MWLDLLEIAHLEGYRDSSVALAPHGICMESHPIASRRQQMPQARYGRHQLAYAPRVSDLFLARPVGIEAVTTDSTFILKLKLNSGHHQLT